MVNPDIGYIFEKPKKVRRPRSRNFVAFDTETRPDGSFICGAYFGYTTKRNGYIKQIADYYDNILRLKKEYHRKAKLTLDILQEKHPKALPLENMSED